MFLFLCAALLDMTINQFLKSLGLEHLREIFQREQVHSYPTYIASLLAAQLFSSLKTSEKKKQKDCCRNEPLPRLFLMCLCFTGC